MGVFACAIHSARLNPQQLALQPIPQFCHLSIIPALQPRQFRRLPQAHNPRNILRPRTPRALVPPPILDWLQLSSLPYIKRAHALRPVQLMPRNRQQIAPNLFHAHRNLPRRLHRVGMKINSRLNHAGLIIGEHDGNQLRIRPQCALHIRRIDGPASVHGDVGHCTALFFHMPASIQHRMVLNRRRNNLVPGLRNSENGKVVRLCPAAREHDLRSAAAEQRGHRLARPLYRRPRLLPMMMNGGCVAEVLREVRPHGLQNLRQRRSRCVIVKVNPAHEIVFYSTDGAPLKGIQVPVDRRDVYSGRDVRLPQARTPAPAQSGEASAFLSAPAPTAAFSRPA